MAEMVIGKTIRIPAMRRGVVEYSDERVLVTQDALEDLNKTAYGIPVVVDHPDKAIDQNSIKEITVVGRVAKFDYDPSSDLWFAEFVVDDQKAVELLQKGWGVSTAWYPNEYKAGGTYNNVPFDRELVSGRYEHLAIVQNPRYEMARNPVFLNSKKADGQTKQQAATMKADSKKQNQRGEIMFKIFGKREIMVNENEELVVELEHEHIPLKTILEEVKSMEAKKQEDDSKKESKKILSNEDEVEVEGKKMKVHELLKKHAELKAMLEPKKHEDKKEHEEKKEEVEVKEEVKKHEDEKKEDKCNEEKKEEVEVKEEVKKHEDEKKDNSFKSLKTANENGAPFDIQKDFLLTSERVELGRQKYGFKK